MWIPKILLAASVWAAYVVSTMWSLLIARRLERSKRFRGRSTTGFIASALSVAALVLGLGMSDVLGIPTPDSPDAGAQDVGATGSLMILSAGACGGLAFIVAGVLGPRRRHRPNEYANLRMSEVLGRVARLVTPLFLAVIAVSWLIGLHGHRPTSLLGWLGAVAVLPLGLLVFAYLGQQLTQALRHYADMLAGQAHPGASTDRLVLYLRPFDEERRIFTDGKTVDEFLAAEVTSKIGRLVALGDPTDRVAPLGAARHYPTDDEWRSEFARLTESAVCFLAGTAYSDNTLWELRCIRQMGRREQLYLLRPPTSAPETAATSSLVPLSGPVALLTFVGRLVNAFLDDDTRRISLLVSRGRLPTSLSRADSQSWVELSRTLSEAGYPMLIDDPGPGSVVGFDADGSAVVVAQRAASASDYVSAIVARLNTR